MSFFHKKMSENLWATIMPFGPVTNILLAQKCFFGPADGWPHFRYCYSYSYYYSPFFPSTMNLSMADLRNYWTEFHETWWSYRYMFLVDPKVFRFVVKGVKAIFLGVQRGWRLL